MRGKHISQQHRDTFDSIRQQDEHNYEYWYARQLAKALEYSEYRHFLPVIERAKTACRHSGHTETDHFEDILEMVKIGSGAQRALENVRLSRYACYLIVQNGDPSKSVIANGQTYFALQARRQELADDARFGQLSEDDKRLAIRHELATHNRQLAAAAKDVGVETPLDYAIFQDHGYKGLYGGLGAKAIHAKKRLKKSQKILDHMSSTELAANLFRATQTEEKLRRDAIKSKFQANQTHLDVGQKVRKTIRELGGTMPENLPVPNRSIQQIESVKKKQPAAQMLGKQASQEEHTDTLSSKLATEARNALLDQLPGQLAARVGGLGQRHPPEQVRELVVALCQHRPWKIEELAILLARNPETIRQNYLRPLLAGRRIQMTLPDTPKSPLQAYRSVEESR